MPPAVEAQRPNHWTAMEFPIIIIFKPQILLSGYTSIYLTILQLWIIWAVFPSLGIIVLKYIPRRGIMVSKGINVFMALDIYF